MQIQCGKHEYIEKSIVPLSQMFVCYLNGYEMMLDSPSKLSNQANERDPFGLRWMNWNKKLSNVIQNMRRMDVSNINPFSRGKIVKINFLK